MSNEITREAKKALFESAEAADREYQAALEEANRLQNKRSNAIEQILNVLGKGPFLYNGETVIIVQRGNTFFFRGKNRKDVQEI